MKFKVGFSLFKTLSEIHLIAKRKVYLQGIASQPPQWASCFILRSQALFWPAPSPLPQEALKPERRGEQGVGRRLLRGRRRKKREEMAEQGKEG